MHTYVLTSFCIYAISAVVVLLGIALTGRATRIQVFSLFTTAVWLIWAAVLLFGA